MQRYLPLLYLATVLALHAAMAGTGMLFPHPASVIAMGLGLGQTVLWAGWLIFGSGKWGLRLVGTFALIAVVSELLTHVAKPQREEWMALLSAVAAAIVLPGWFLRRDGARLAAPGEAERTSPVRRWQFTTAALLLAVTTVSVLLAWYRLLRFPWEHGAAVTIYILSFAAIGWVSLWLAFYRGPAIHWVIATAVLASVAGYGLRFVEGEINPDSFALCALTEALTVLGGVFVVQISGYRLHRPKRP